MVGGRSIRASVVAFLAAGVLLTGAGTAAATTEAHGEGDTETPYGVLRVNFDDQWAGSGQRTWTIDNATSRVWWTADDDAPSYGRPSDVTLVDELCFAKYGFDSVSVGGSGLTAGAGAQSSCGTRRGTADPGYLFVTNTGKIIARGNYYGRWLWFQHRAQASARIGSVNYYAEAYAKVTPDGYDV